MSNLRSRHDAQRGPSSQASPLDLPVANEGRASLISFSIGLRHDGCSIEVEDLEHVVAQVAALRGVGEWNFPTFASTSLQGEQWMIAGPHQFVGAALIG